MTTKHMYTPNIQNIFTLLIHFRFSFRFLSSLLMDPDHHPKLTSFLSLSSFSFVHPKKVEDREKREKKREREEEEKASVLGWGRRERERERERKGEAPSHKHAKR